jgi:hypothetical protein
MDTGKTSETKSGHGKTGIQSWDEYVLYLVLRCIYLFNYLFILFVRPQVDERKEAKKAVVVGHMAVQTEDTSFIFPAESSSWLNQGSVDSSSYQQPQYQPIPNKWQLRHDIDSMSMGVHSVPTVMNPVPPMPKSSCLDGDSISSSVLDSPDILPFRTQSLALPPKKPAMARADFIAKTRPVAPFSADFYSSSDNYSLPQEKITLAPTRRINKIKNSVSHSLDDGNNSVRSFGSGGDMRIAGKKYAGPLMLPRIGNQGQ